MQEENTWGNVQTTELGSWNHTVCQREPTKSWSFHVSWSRLSHNDGIVSSLPKSVCTMTDSEDMKNKAVIVLSDNGPQVVREKFKAFGRDVIHTTPVHRPPLPQSNGNQCRLWKDCWRKQREWKWFLWGWLAYRATPLRRLWEDVRRRSLLVC